ncbi:hypothetical protein SAMN03159390_04812 [Pseudomonas sp. NFACC49-2]|uniref:hypothetical protein n=1 Tax=Pseudomonas sp. NFACC49-2 TaxID=1566222 RepID=UPI000923AF51|nr:hypothetical protein [Pseudomonas sp. NFACC49-2]SFY29750.1 hypothetical protein SAMN03159390_04812 [Pseudomonas sp. NFACC49-2]
MNDSRHTQDPQDDLMIEHFREHAGGEPPASLDAFILAAARREAPAPKPSLWQRWLQACQRPRWQVAFASLAGVALMIGLVLRAPEPRQAPATLDFSAARQAPAVIAEAPPPAPAPAPMARMAPQAEMAQVPADRPAAKMSKPAAPLSLENELLEILRLRQAGQSRAADEKLLALHARFPQEDLPARLEALQGR